MQKRQRSIKKDHHEMLSTASIRRLASRAGVKRMNERTALEVKSGVIKVYVDQITRSAQIIAEYAGRKTIRVADVAQALRLKGEKLYGFDA